MIRKVTIEVHVGGYVCAIHELGKERSFVVDQKQLPELMKIVQKLTWMEPCELIPDANPLENETKP